MLKNVIRDKKAGEMLGRTKPLVLLCRRKRKTTHNMKNEKTYTLTKSEMQVMKVLWSAGRAVDVHEIIAQYDEPKPAYTTVGTFLKILTTKGFVDYKKGNGKQYLYFPLISQAQYTGRVMRDVKDMFFDGKASSLLRFFVEEEQLNEEDIRELIDMVRNKQS